MKALLVHHERPFRKTHNLTELGHAVVTLEPSLIELMKRHHERTSDDLSSR